MAKGLTDRQQEVFNFIVTYIEEKGYPPTIREMQVGLGIGSLRGVTIHLDALHKKGYIERLSSKNGPRTQRGIRILARLEGRAKDEDARRPAPAPDRHHRRRDAAAGDPEHRRDRPRPDLAPARRAARTIFCCAFRAKA